MKNPIAFFFVLVLLLCFGTGCGPRTVPVSGAIKFDGVPGQNINVLFQGKSDGKVVPEAAYAKTDAQGRYSLALVRNNQSGAFPGEYVVYLTWKDPNADPNPIEGVTVANPEPYKIPSRAKNGRLTITVPQEGTKNADFEFQSEKEDFDETGV